MDNIYIPIVLGTGRENRRSEHVANLVHQKLSQYTNVQTEIIDVREYVQNPVTIPAWVEDTNASKWRKIASQASGYIFVVPEYNWSYPGEFKLLIDSAYKEYEGKPAVLVGVSDGDRGGVRVIQQLASLLLALKIEALGSIVATAHAETLFTDENKVAREKYEKFVDEALITLITRLS